MPTATAAHPSCLDALDAADRRFGWHPFTQMREYQDNPLSLVEKFLVRVRFGTAQSGERQQAAKERQGSTHGDGSVLGGEGEGSNLQEGLGEMR